MFNGPWPHPEMWWCACVENDCQAALIGPLESFELAHAEANGDCDNPHIAIKGEPPLDSPVRVSFPGQIIYYDIEASEAWRSWFTYNRTGEKVGASR